MVERIYHVGLTVSDLDRSIAFLTETSLALNSKEKYSWLAKKQTGCFE